MKYFHPHFDSFEEYEAYLHCTSKVEVGDEVEYYSYGGYPTGKKTTATNNSIVIAKTFIILNISQFIETRDFRLGILCGSKIENKQFWNLSTNPQSLVSKIKDFDEYKSGYFAYVGQMRIAKIIKNRI